MRVFMKEENKHETWEYKDIEKVCIISEETEECLLISKRKYPTVGKISFKIDVFYKSCGYTKMYTLELESGEAIVSAVKDFPVELVKIWKFL